MPFPPDYGGVIDVFNRIKHLKEIGFSIILHCFDYNSRAGENQIGKLKGYCEEVHIYTRKKSVFFLFSRLPFIVISRWNKKLLDNLLQNDFPILFEGIHTTAFISHPALKNRFKVLRTHNVEQEYYRHLAESTNRFLKKLFYRVESRKLKRYEPKTLPFAQKVLAVSEADKYFFEKLNPDTVILMPSMDFETITEFSKTGEKFILFHGNLSVEENEKAALFLMESVFSKIDFPVIIAGKNPSLKLQEAVAKNSHIRLIQSPDEKTMQKLMASAHIHILYSFQDTGVKLKLMNVLRDGKFCIANDLILGKLPVENLLTVANRSEEILSAIDALMSRKFDIKLTESRKMFLTAIKQKNENILKNIFTGGQ